MDISRIKDVFGRLGFIKNYSAYILPILLTAGALLLLVPAKVLSVRLRNTVGKQSVDKGKQVKNLSAQQVSSRQWQVERLYQDALATDANGMAELLSRTAQRELLSYNLFPQPKDTSVQIFEQFGQGYRQAIERLITEYGAKHCPTQVEIDQALRKTGTEQPYAGGDFSPRASLGGEMGGWQASTRNVGRVEQMIVDELCRATAANASFYASVYDIAGYEYWGKGGGDGDAEGGGESVYQYQSIEQSVQECWYWQVGYWIIEDVFAAIGVMNSGCRSVLDCPVKRLEQVGFGTAGQAQMGVIAQSSARPSYVTSGGGALVPSCTGRVGNEQWDIVHFRVVVLTSARSVLPFMEELCRAKEHTFKGWSGQEAVRVFKHNQITILSSRIAPVVPGVAAHELYRYGDDPVVEMELVCEYVFERAGYDQIKPEFIKNPVAAEVSQ